MDANAIFLAAYTRNVTIERNECVWVGMSCVVTFGYVPRNDATDGEQPWGTVIAYNLLHEFGIQEMQSSGWFSGKAALTRAEGNIMCASGESRGRRGGELTARNEREV